MNKKFLLLSLVISLSSCVTNYKIPADYQGSLATIKDTAKQTGITKSEAFRVSKINGLDETSSPMATPYGGGLGVTLKKSQRQIPAKSPIKISLYGGNMYAADGAALADMMTGNAVKTVTGDVIFTPKPEGIYRVNGVAGKNSSSVWIEEESTGKIVTEKITHF